MEDFPQYRKYKNDRNFFKITSKKQFEEIQFIGKKLNFHQFEAKILPDRNRIADMLEMRNGFWVICEANEFEELKKQIRS